MVSFFFFFSSRRRHTRWNCDWSSDVCSSDLAAVGRPNLDHLCHAGIRVVLDELPRHQTADVFALAYSQEVGVERVAETPVLRQAVSKLKALGYREVVLVGHSAGGLVARQTA